MDTLKRWARGVLTVAPEPGVEGLREAGDGVHRGTAH